MTGTGFADDFRRSFLTGIAALFPILITLFLLTWLYRHIDVTIGRQANAVCREVLARNPALFRVFFYGVSEQHQGSVSARRTYARGHFPRVIGSVVGLAAALVLVYLLGRVLRGYIGRGIMLAVDRFFERFPVIKAVYPHARQVGDFIFGQSERRRFTGVVAVQYPRQGIYSVGFLTGRGLKGIEEQAGRELVTVFVPTSPTPVTGFIIAVSSEEVTRLEMTVDEAFRYFITAGMLSSAGQEASRLGLGSASGEALPAGGQEQARSGAAATGEP
ncbi:MAG: DUF502 domain-containing protein [Planctomycetota bacterium]|jgi:uncharacterized membrane protein